MPIRAKVGPAERREIVKRHLEEGPTATPLLARRYGLSVSRVQQIIREWQAQVRSGQAGGAK